MKFYDLHNFVQTFYMLSAKHYLISTTEVNYERDENITGFYPSTHSPHRNSHKFKLAL